MIEMKEKLPKLLYANKLILTQKYGNKRKKCNPFLCMDINVKFLIRKLNSIMC
jgi:hypothetical protein